MTDGLRYKMDVKNLMINALEEELPEGHCELIGAAMKNAALKDILEPSFW